MDEVGTVVSIAGNKARVMMEQHSQCKGCSACSAKTTGLAYLEVENTLNAKVGEQVIIKIKLTPLQISGLVYGLPTLLLFLGIVIGDLVCHSDLWGLAWGVGFMALSLAPIRIIAGKNQPEMVETVLEPSFREIAHSNELIMIDPHSPFIRE